MMKQKFKKMMTLATVSLMALTSSAAVLPATAAHAETTVLMQGVSNSSVWSLQANLKTLGYYDYYTETGYFGSITEAGVKQFQQAYGLTADGIVGPATDREIDHALVKRNIVGNTWNYVGIPYRWGGTTTAGFDCSGFVNYMFHQQGIYTLPRTSADMYNVGKHVATSDLKPGDLVFYSLNNDGRISHVGIYIGNGQFMSATSSHGVYAQPMSNSYWAPKYMGARRPY